MSHSLKVGDTWRNAHGRVRILAINKSRLTVLELSTGFRTFVDTCDFIATHKPSKLSLLHPSR